jgi:hypothetical protein
VSHVFLCNSACCGQSCRMCSVVISVHLLQHRLCAYYSENRHCLLIRAFIWRLQCRILTLDIMSSTERTFSASHYHLVWY